MSDINNRLGSVKKHYGQIYDLYLMNAKHGSKACKIAEKLISISGVEEVLVTEGDFGFLVKARQNSASNKIYNAIQSHARGSMRSVTSYYRYTK